MRHDLAGTIRDLHRRRGRERRGRTLAEGIRLVEEALIREALAKTDGNVTRSARALGISRRSLQSKMKELGLRESPDEGGPKGPPGPGACSNCGQGKSNSSLDSALRAAAGSARGCYNRALQKNAGAAGKLTVNVQVGPSGAVCGASISNDTVGSGEVSTCVLQRFQGKSFPKPDQGCVSVAIPMSFEVKQ